ncbi:hypothetical protein [Agrobacterium burrii]
MADRIVDGATVMQQIGSPLDLHDRPANLFVAGFIGSPGINFMAISPTICVRDKMVPLPAGYSPTSGQKFPEPVIRDGR